MPASKFQEARAKEVLSGHGSAGGRIVIGAFEYVGGDVLRVVRSDHSNLDCAIHHKVRCLVIGEFLSLGHCVPQGFRRQLIETEITKHFGSLVFYILILTLIRSVCFAECAEAAIRRIEVPVASIAGCGAVESFDPRRVLEFGPVLREIAKWKVDVEATIRESRGTYPRNRIVRIYAPSISVSGKANRLPPIE